MVGYSKKRLKIYFFEGRKIIWFVEQFTRFTSHSANKRKLSEMFFQQQVASSRSSKQAIKRISTDYREFQAANHTTIFASPVREDDFFGWAVNILAPTNETRYKGIVVHCHIQFNDTYPSNPPTVRMCSLLHHGHIHGEHICLDMLRTHHSSEAYSGWSSAYSLNSLLMQLQAFFFEEEDLRRTAILSDILQNSEFRCAHCEHNMKLKQPFPELSKNAKLELLPFSMLRRKLEKRFDWKNPTVPAISILEDDTVVDETPPSMPEATACSSLIKNFNLISEHELKHIFSFLELKDLKICEKVSRLWERAANVRFHQELQETICFHTKLNFMEDVLGVGLYFDVIPNSGKIKRAHTSLDLISKTAFFEFDIRQSVWNEEFTNWIPLYICQDHMNRAFPLFSIAIQDMNETKIFNPKTAVDLLCTLMNSMVVNVMDGTKHASLKALQGYCYFHRLLLHLTLTFKEVRDDIEKRTAAFVAKPEQRTKTNCRDLGEFLALVSVSSKSWDDVAPAIIEESRDRNVLWIIKKYSHLAKVPQPGSELKVPEDTLPPKQIQQQPSAGSSSRKRARSPSPRRSRSNSPRRYYHPIDPFFNYPHGHQHSYQSAGNQYMEHKRYHDYKYVENAERRLSESFDSASVGCKLHMFHAYFLRTIVHKGKRCSLEEIAQAYDKYYGRVTLAQQEALQREIFKIQQTNSYSTFYEYTLGKTLPKQEIYNLLLAAVRNSERKGYHSSNTGQANYQQRAHSSSQRRKY